MTTLDPKPPRVAPTLCTFGCPDNPPVAFTESEGGQIEGFCIIHLYIAWRRANHNPLAVVGVL